MAQIFSFFLMNMIKRKKKEEKNFNTIHPMLQKIIKKIKLKKYQFS